jgi:hypothetical protein
MSWAKTRGTRPSVLGGNAPKGKEVRAVRGFGSAELVLNGLIESRSSSWSLLLLGHRHFLLRQDEFYVPPKTDL